MCSWDPNTDGFSAARGCCLAGASWANGDFAAATSAVTVGAAGRKMPEGQAGAVDAVVGAALDANTPADDAVAGNAVVVAAGKAGLAPHVG